MLTPQSINPVSIIGSVIAVSFVMARQAQWLEAIERRIAVTSQMLGSMKGVKMCGLTDVLGTHIQAMRMEELRISGKFRRLLIWNMGLGKCFKDRWPDSYFANCGICMQPILLLPSPPS